MEAIESQSPVKQPHDNSIKHKVSECCIPRTCALQYGWLNNEEFLEVLKISKRTAQHYRTNGIISFSQVGRKIYYRISDVQELLERHSKNAIINNKH